MSPQWVNSPKIEPANDTKRNPVIFLYLIKFRSSFSFYWQRYQGRVHLHQRRGEKICSSCVGEHQVFFFIWGLSGKGFRISHTSLIWGNPFFIMFRKTATDLRFVTSSLRGGSLFSYSAQRAAVLSCHLTERILNIAVSQRYRWVDCLLNPELGAVCWWQMSRGWKKVRFHQHGLWG